MIIRNSFLTVSLQQKVGRWRTFAEARPTIDLPTFVVSSEEMIPCRQLDYFETVIGLI